MKSERCNHQGQQQPLQYILHCVTLLLALLHNVMFSAVNIFQHYQTKAFTELYTKEDDEGTKDRLQNPKQR